MIKDNYHRTHNYLRISLTDVCNLRCFYCMPNEHYDFTPAEHLMRATEIESIAQAFVDLGVNKIRLTGGEPMARKDFDDILLRLANLPVSLHLTTNATLLDKHIGALKAASIDDINISLDTLSAKRFQYLTRRDKFKQTMDNIQLAIQEGLHVKINMVVMKGINEDEILDFVAWTRHQPIDVRFIEFMPFAGNRWTSNDVFTWQEVVKVIEARYAMEAIQGGMHDTAKQYRITGHRGAVAVISTMSAPFCSGCNRMRLTADGKMKNCLFSKDESDLLTALRSGRPIKDIIERNVLSKAERLGGQFGADYTKLDGGSIENRSMISIGG